MEEPHPLNERQSHEAELAQLRDRIAVYRGEPTGEPAPDEMRQGWLDWQSPREEPHRPGRELAPRRALMTTRAQQAGLRLEDIPRPSLAKLRRRHKLDAQVRQALGLVRWQRPKN